MGCSAVEKLWGCRRRQKEKPFYCHICMKSFFKHPLFCCSCSTAAAPFLLVARRHKPATPWFSHSRALSLLAKSTLLQSTTYVVYQFPLIFHELPISLFLWHSLWLTRSDTHSCCYNMCSSPSHSLNYHATRCLSLAVDMRCTVRSRVLRRRPAMHPSRSDANDRAWWDDFRLLPITHYRDVIRIRHPPGNLHGRIPSTF